MKQFSAGFLLLFFSTIICGLSHAQNATDALRLSTNNIMSTARGTAVGGALGALGADASTLTSNPAGVGAWRSSELMLTGAVFSTSTESLLLANPVPANTETNTRFNLTNVGVVFAGQSSGSIKTSNFAIAYNRTADYHAPFAFRGRNQGSITDRHVELADGFYPDELNPYEEGLAYTTGAIYDLNEDLFYTSDYLLNPDAPLLRRQNVERSGAKHEILIAYGLNINEKLLLGATVGVPIFRFEENTQYEEEDDVTDPVPFFNALRFEEDLSIRGTGINFRIGGLYKISKFINVGMAYHTRTRYSLSDTYETSFLYDFTDDIGRQVFEDFSPTGDFNYGLSTPWALVFNAGAVIKQTGFVVAEIEYVDFRKARFDYSRGDNGDIFDFEEQLVNEDIRNSFSSTINIRLGGEYAYKKLRARAGINLPQSPFADDSGFDPVYSAGLGLKFRRVFLDFAYQYQQTEIGHLPYATNFGPQPQVNNTTSNNRFFLTLGYKWL